MASSILKYFISMVFIFSTVYTMSFYYFAASGEISGVETATDTTGVVSATAINSTGAAALASFGFVEWLGEFLSWLSPFALIKGMMVTLLPTMIYQPINLLFLRPIGWIGTWITTEWVINKIRGSSES